MAVTEEGPAPRNGGNRANFMRRGNPRPMNGQDQHIYSALDLGTNNCRLLVARPANGGFRVIDAFSRIVRLGEGIAANGTISEDAINRAIEALKVCAQKIEKRGVTRMRHVATEACRAASNGDEFIARVRAETGLSLDIISPAEEAKLAVIGCQTLLDRNARRAVVFDIGGGSTEIILVAISRHGEPHILDWTSVPLGVVNLTETFGGPDPALHFVAMREMVRPHVKAFAERVGMKTHVARHVTQLLGTSGTVTTLASMHLELPRYDRAQVDGLWVDVASMRKITNILATATPEGRAAIPSIGAERADYVVAGCAILEAIFDAVEVQRLRIADRGIREGLLRLLMRKDPNHANGERKSGKGKPGKRRPRRRKPKPSGDAT